MSLLPGSSMSLLKSLQNIKERFGKPSKKRRKLGEDEDDWCDALNHLSVDSDSDDDEKYFDAQEEFANEPEQQVTSDLRGKKRKKRQKPVKNKSSKMSDMKPFQHTSSPSRGRRTNEGVIEQRQRQSSTRHSNSGGFQYGLKDSSFSTPMETEPYHFAAGRSNTATSSSSEAGVQFGSKRLTTIHDPPQEHPMKGYTGGISDSKLEKLAKDLMGDEFLNARLLGMKLGFSRTDFDRYCGSGKPKYSTGILRMLRAWKDKTHYAKQMSGLLEALRKANLKHLADDLDLQEAPSTSTTKKTEPVRSGNGRSNTAHSSSSETDVQVGPKQSATSDDASQSQLPMKDYTDKGCLTEAKLKKVADAIGDNIDKIRLLGGKLGFGNYWIKNNARGISGALRMLHDWKLRTTKAEQMPKLLAALKSSQLQNVADLLHQEQGFVKHPPDGDTPAIEINPEQPATTDDKSGKVCQEENQLSDKSSGWFGRLGNWFVWFVLFGWLQWLLSKAWPTRIPSIYICTSLGTRSIHGLKKKLQSSLDSSRCVVQELELPYNRLEDFKFPSEVDKSDAMILCHSVENRGFSITDVQDSIYDEFLKYCNQVFGEDHMVVVVHDFNFNQETLKGRMETFQSMQPMTFKMAGLVVLAGKLDDIEVQLCQDVLAQLEKFVKKFC